MDGCNFRGRERKDKCYSPGRLRTKKRRTPDDGGEDTTRTTVDDWEFLAVTEGGLSSSEFWELTLYDWGLILERIRAEQDKIVSERRFQKDMWGNWMATYVNFKSKIKFELNDIYPREEDTNQPSKEENISKVEAALKNRGIKDG